MSAFHNNALIGSSNQGYTISRSVRLRNSATGYFSRTIGATATNAKIGTLSMWVKRGGLTSATGNSQYLIQTGISATTDSGHFTMYFTTSDNLSLGQYSWAGYSTTQVFRDPSAWYHIVLSYNSTLASNNLTIYVNGVQIAVTSVVQNTNWAILSGTEAINIGRHTSVGRSFDGYLTEINLIDGQALTPSSFGETNPITGVWQPKKYAGTYGTNGFYLNFSDNSGATATTIGKDYSGNGNNWTPSAGISITAGATYDSMIDVPTPYADGGNGRGNYAVLNPVDLGYIAALSEANLKVSTASAGNAAAGSTIAMSGNTYWEVTIGSNSQVGLLWGRASDAYGNSSISMFASGATGSLNNATRTLSATPSWSNGDTLGLAWNSSTRVLTLYQAGSATAVMTILTPATGDPQAAVVNYTSGAVMSSQVNFGQRPFTYTPPTGFKALNTQNLPTPTISKGNQYMDVVLYTGNAASPRTISGAGFQPDFIWDKSRSARSHTIWDSVRGVGVSKELSSNLTDAEGGANISTAVQGYISAITADGFTMTSGSSAINAVNANGENFVAWLWNAGGSTVTNTSGTISSQVRANPTAGFSVVTYTGTGANATVGHGLNATPAMIIVKNRDSGAIGGAVYHTSLGATKYLKLFQTTTGSDNAATDNTAWNGGSPTFNSSVFSVGSLNRTNSSQQMVAYCFAAVSGYSAFGSYAVNNSADGPFVYLGFRARWILFKNNGASTWNWMIVDTARDAINTVNSRLFPDLSNAESSTASPYLDITANGFKIRTTGGLFNTEGPVIYAAFAENPFKYSLAR